jgi:hypothetical protein
MARVAYTVAVTFADRKMAKEWLSWLADGHIAKVLAAGASDAEVVFLENDGLSFEIRYHFPSRGTFAAYQKEMGPRLRAEGLARFPEANGVTYRRTVGLVVDPSQTAAKHR